MFMFRSRRTNLVKQLWKARLRSGDEAEEPARLLLKRLDESQLEELLTAFLTGGKAGSCLLLREREHAESRTPPLLSEGERLARAALKSWRWPELPAKLRRLPPPLCRATPDAPCANPFHYSALATPDSPPPPYCRFANERLKPEDRAPSESSQHQLELRGSLSTNGEGEAEEGQWCKLAYWEHAERVGRQFGVRSPAVNVFWHLPRGDGLCLETLAAQRSNPPESVSRAREKIGIGLTLSREKDGVWAYNRSDCPMFVNSPGLDEPSRRSLVVYRLPPGHCLNVFTEEARGATGRGVRRGGGPQGPVDLNSVRISFAKGWGPKYSRQEITACPTWIEVLLAPCR